MRTLFLITARGGSKGIPGKNLRELGGISLVGFKAISARKSRYCTRLIISTDSPEIQEDARRYGVEVPFTRPSPLASDTASSADVIRHAMEWIEGETSETYDALMLLEPSSPFARPTDLDAAVELMLRKDARMVVGMRRATVSSVFVGPMDEEGRITAIIDKMGHLESVLRQDTPQEYTMNGGLYLFRWDYLKADRSLYRDRDHSYGYVMPDDYSVEIDEPKDLHYAEFLVARGYVDISHWG